MKNKLALIFIISGFLLISCGDSGTTPSNINLNSLIPLNDGNTWTYSKYDYKGSYLGDVSWTMVSLGNKTWNFKYFDTTKNYSKILSTFGFKIVDGNKQWDADEFYAQNGDTMYHSMNYNSAFYAFYLSGSSSQTKLKDLGYGIPVFLIGNYDITVPAGKFNTFEIAQFFGESTSEGYYAVGIGMVKYKSEYTLILKNYSVN